MRGQGTYLYERTRDLSISEKGPIYIRQVTYLYERGRDLSISEEKGPIYIRA